MARDTDRDPARIATALRSRSVIVLAAALAALLIGACEDDYGEPCDLPTSAAVEAYCEPTEDENGATTATCAFTNSTQCETRMCATYIGSRGFCTMDCDPEAADGCPSGSLCLAMPATGVAFCVPENILESVE